MSDKVTVSEDIITTLCDFHDEDDIREDYSGRGMYGRTCLAYTGEDMILFTFRLAAELAKEGEDDADLFTVEELLIMIGDPTVDQMGRGLIYYWPNVQVTASE